MIASPSGAISRKLVRLRLEQIQRKKYDFDMTKKGKLGVVGGCIGFSILFSVLTLLWSESHSSNSSIEWFGDDWGEAGDYVGKAMFDRDAHTGMGGPIHESIDHYVWDRLYPNGGFTKKRFVLIT